MLVTIAMAAASLPASAAVASSNASCENRNINTMKKFLQCVNGDDVFTHLEAFQQIADENGGTRASGTPGYDESAAYVADLLEDAGYDVTVQEFEFSSFTENSSSLTIDGVDTPTGAYEFSGSGTIVDGNVVPVQLELGPDNASTSGCEIEDFDGLDFSGANDVALIQRGACNFSAKALNAQASGAEAVIIFNQGNNDGRLDTIVGTLGDGVVGTLTIPVVGGAYADGVALNDGATVSLSVDATIETATTSNVIADLDGLNTDNVVMAGAHLDSVQEGPGIQDNGTGSAAILATALALGNNKKYVPQNSLRFAWWGAEESGLIGSEKYIFDPEFGISQEDYDALALYLNFDMVGSPNFIYGVYDADQSSFEAPVAVPEGSSAIEDVFEAFYTLSGVPYEDTEFSGRSDYQAFIDVGIPSGGLFTGAEVLKTEEQQAIWGGVAGEQFDQCYHEACDTIENVSEEAVEVNIDAIAFSIYGLAATTEPVNGVEGIDLMGQSLDDIAFDGPQGTFLDGGGGLDHDHDHGGPVS